MILALDIGGANTKIALVEDQKVIWRGSFYFPFWKHKDNFEDFLFALFHDMILGTIEAVNFEPNRLDEAYEKKLRDISAIGITMTAELSDAFRSKDEGVNFILNCVLGVFSHLPVPVYVLSNNGNLISIDDARKKPYSFASANWTATSWYAAKKYSDCILADIGSTTTDIILIKNGKIAARGKTDLGRLQTGELIYTGVLRTNVAAVTDSVRIKNRKTPVSSELFAETADVYLILNKISEKDYACETADGRGKSRKECMARLSRVVCADLNELSEKEIVEMAEYIKEKQMEKIIEGIKRVSGNGKTETLVAIGIGNFLVKEIGEKLNITVIEMDMNPAGALGLMVEEKLSIID